MEATFRSGTTVLGKYRIESALGREGMYVVLRVSHAQLGSDLVLRMLVPETATSLAMQARLVREAQAAARLRSGHVARIVDLGISSDGVPYVVSEAVRGVDLAAEIARRGALPPAEAIDHALQVCEALAEAHACGVSHRSLGPGSIVLVAGRAGAPRVVLRDFGTAPPGPSEELDVRGDLRALGAVLYECLTGRRPFPGMPAGPPPPAARTAAAEAPPPMDPRIPLGLQGVVLRCLGDRDAGFPSAAALAAALAPFADDEQAATVVVARADLLAQGASHPIEPAHPPDPAPAMVPAAAVPGASPPAVPWSRSRRRYATIAVVALGASIGGISAAALLRSGRSRSPAAAPATAAPATAAPATAAPPRATPSAPTAAPGTTARPASGPPAAAPPATARPASGPPAAAPPATARPASGPPAGSGRDNDAGKAQKLAACGELLAQQRWQALDDCASELDRLGVTGKAEQLHATARQELQNEILNRQAQQALRDGDLRQAQATVQQIDPGSVYLAALRDALAAAEQQRSDDARRSAQSLASAHDCAALKRLVSQLRATATERVAAAAREVRCEDAPPPARAAARPPSPSGPPATVPRTHQDSCATLDVGDLMTRAATRYDAGSASAALSLTRVALGCKQTDRMYWLAVMYACAAHDAASARLYFPKIPANLQPGIERKCQQENLDVRTR